MNPTTATRTAPAQTVEQPAPQAESALLDRIIEQTSDRLDALADRYTHAIAETPAPLRRAMILADGIHKLRQALTPELMQRIMALMNSQLGFKTDRPNRKDNTPYPEAIVKDCVIEALLQGVYPVGNEFNIIAGRCYITKEAYQRKVRELPDLTDLQLMPGIPRLDNGRTVVRYGASWRLAGSRQELRDAEGKPGRVFAIIAYESATADNILGKATRKALKAIYDQVTGSAHLGGDDDEEVVSSSTEAAPTAAPTSSPPTGPVSLRGNGKTSAAPAAAIPEPAPPAPEPVPPAAPATPAEPPAIEAAAPPPQSDQDEMALADLISDVQDRIEAAKTQQELNLVGAEMHRNQDWLGEFKYQQLLSQYQAKSRQIKAATDAAKPRQRKE